MKKRDFRSLFMLLAAGLVFLLSTAGGYAQTKKGLYDVSINNLSLKEALMKVSTQCGYYFVYEDADLASAPKVNKEFKSSTIEQILAGCLEGTQLTFQISRKNVYIRKAASGQNSQSGPSSRTSAAAQQGYVTGVVSDVSGGDQSRIMLTGRQVNPGPDDESPYFNEIKSNYVETKEGFGFLDNIIIDQHFIARRRQVRLINVLLDNPGYRGIGIDEECAVVVNPDNTIEIVGTGCAMMFEPYKKGEDGGNAHSFKLTVLYPGDKYNI